MAIALAGAASLFSLLQEAFWHEETDLPRLCLTKALMAFLDGVCVLAADIVSRPTRIAELLPGSIPATLGACDAAGTGMGGVHFVPDTTGKVLPILWRNPFPQWVQDRRFHMTTAGYDILAQFADIVKHTIHNSYDNTAAVFWQPKRSTTAVGPAAYLFVSRHFTNASTNTANTMAGNGGTSLTLRSSPSLILNIRRAHHGAFAPCKSRPTQE